MKQYLKLELLVELPAGLEIELIKHPTTQVDNPTIVDPDKKTIVEPERIITVDSDKKMTMSVEELAEELQISKTTIYTMVSHNEIPHIKVRGRILFHRANIEKWLVEGS